jgi:hypothetical protein
MSANCVAYREERRNSHPESVAILALGCSSWLPPVFSSPRSQSSKTVSLEKSASTAPARVPVAIKGRVEPGDQAKVAVLGISRRRTMVVRK